MIDEELRKIFSNSDVDSAYQIDSVGSDYPAYAVRFLGRYGVAVPYDGKEVREEFANAELYSDYVSIGEESIQCLFLTSRIEATRNEFVAFCRDFVDPGSNGNKRKLLVSDPVEWWKNWKHLIGNSISEKKPYAILAELLAYEYLLRKGVNVEWGGPKATSHDIIGKDIEYEVKSTTSRYGSTIHVAGPFQMQREKRLLLYFCRFEQNINGECINDVVERLVSKMGERRDELNEKLAMQGYRVGSSARDEKYQLHEALQYEVDDQFPKITPESFLGGKIPKGISQVEYNVDLSLLDGTVIELQ